MRTILYIIQKEFIQVFRNKTMLPIIFVLPIVQMIILVHAATLEMKKIELFVVDQDHSEFSRGLISKFKGSPFFEITQYGEAVKEGEKALLKDEADAVLIIPSNFERTVYREQKGSLQLQINAINGMVAGLINAYSNAIMADYSRDIISEMSIYTPGTSIQQLNITNSYWYNPELNYKIYMVPGILVILVTVIGMFLTALNIVREKEIGNIEQINVKHVKK